MGKALARKRKNFLPSFPRHSSGGVEGGGCLGEWHIIFTKTQKNSKHIVPGNNTNSMKREPKVGRLKGIYSGKK
jgi:hypothetical protein